MSFQKETDTEVEVKLEQEMKKDDTTAFENFIMQCCKADEWDLRKFLRKTLTRAGFEIFEDGYKTDRVSKDKRYDTVHNMLAIRGEKPRVCLVAHTDVCRDHEDSRYSGWGEHQYWMFNRHENDAEVQEARSKLSLQKVEPVIKVVEHEGTVRRVIQDKDCRLQVGGDDRLGVAINTWIALNTGYPMGLFFPTDEEIGLKSAGACKMERLKEFDLLAQVDRGNHSNELVIKIGSEILADYDTATTLLEIAYDIGLPRTPITGASTDVYALHKNGMCKNAINLTCGYHQSLGAGSNEYIDVDEARDTLRYVSEIVKYYYLYP